MMRIILALLFGLLLSTSNAQLLDILPLEARNSVMWYADMEEGTLNDWNDAEAAEPGGEVFMAGGDDAQATADKRFAHTGKFSARASITNAYRAENGDKGIKFRRWADGALDKGGKLLPKEGYYSSFLYIPHIYNPTKDNSWNTDDDGYWNIFDFSNLNNDGTTESIWSLNAQHDASNNKMYLFLRSDKNEITNHVQLATSRISVPVNKWMHLETYYKNSDDGSSNGSISVWQDGNLLFEINDIITTENNNSIVWSVGNTTDHIEGETVTGRASIFIDDSMISSLAIHPYLEATVALPLELVSFDVLNSGNDVEVNWSTTSESNIKHYIVQRRHESDTDFLDFKILEANNQSDGINRYDIFDLESKKVGLYYYRLRVLDNDGQDYFSDLQSITIKGGNFYGIKTFPNPTIDRIHIEGLNDDEDITIINVYDAYGSVMMSQSKMTRLSTSIDLSELNPGIYIVQVSKGLDRYSKKIIKN